MSYKEMSIDELNDVSSKLKDEIMKLKAERKKIADARDFQFTMAKFDQMTDSEKEAMKIYVNGFSSDAKTGKPGTK